MGSEMCIRDRKISDCEIDKDFVEKVTNCLVRILTEEEDG